MSAVPMKRLVSGASAIGVTVALAGPSLSPAADQGSERAAERCRCSASGLAPAKRVDGLPRAVSSMRRRIVAAARRCDYAGLERLGRERGSGFSFSFGADTSAARFWRRLERTGEQPAPMGALVRVLAMPYARGSDGSYVWPSAHRPNPTERDWKALRTLYTPKQIDAMKRGGTGYLGYRAGITASGDWQYFVAGD